MKTRVFSFLPKFSEMPAPKRKLPRFMRYGKIDKQIDKILGKCSLITVRFFFAKKIDLLRVLNQGYNLIRVKAETVEDAEWTIKTKWQKMEEVANLLNLHFVGFEQWE